MTEDIRLQKSFGDHNLKKMEKLDKIFKNRFWMKNSTFCLKIERKIAILVLTDDISLMKDCK